MKASVKLNVTNSNEIVCPICEHRFDNSCEFGDKGDIECTECGETFSFHTEVTVFYLSKSNCLLNDREHDWGPGRIPKCKNCDQRKEPSVGMSEQILADYQKAIRRADATIAKYSG